MNYQCHRCQADLTVGAMGCSKCGMRFAAPVPPLAEPTAAPGVAAAPVTPTPASAGGETTTRLEQMTQALQRKIEADRAKPTRASRLDKFLAARKGVQIPDSVPQKTAEGNGRVVAGVGTGIALAALVLVLLINFTGGAPTGQQVSATTESTDAPAASPEPAQAASPEPAPAQQEPAPAASQAAPPDDLSRFMPPPLPAKQAAPVQQAAPVPEQQAAAPVPPQGGDPNMVARMVEKGFQEDRQPQQTAYAPPVAQTTASPPPFDPTPGYQQAANDVNRCYSLGIRQYNQALYRLHNLNGAGMEQNSMSIDVYWEGILRAKAQCSPNDQPKADELADDLMQKSSLIESAGKSSPTGGN